MSKQRRHKTQNAESHPVDVMLKFQNKWLREFSLEHPDIWEVIGSGINIVNMTQWAIGNKANLSEPELHCLVMWQTVLDYQIQAAILIIQHRLDSGLALLRMASELARDINVIGNDGERLSLWLQKEEKRQEYTKIFKFDKSIPQAQTAYNIYKFCSSFGVHGHVSNNMFSEIKSRTGVNGQFALLDVSQIGILESLEIWLTGFAPINHLCALQFFVNRAVELSDEISIWREFELSSADLNRSFHVSLENLKREPYTQ